MPDQNIGAISIGISADLRALETDLNRAKKAIQDWQVPSKTIRIQVGQPNFNEFNRKINAAIKSAEQREIKLAPTLSVTGTQIKAFRAEIQRVMEGYPVKVPVTADINAEAFHTSIQTAIGGPYSVPLTWHWVDGPPPGDLGGGSVPINRTPGGGGTGGGTGTAGPTPTEPKAERFSPSYTGPSPRDQEILRQRAEEDLGKKKTAGAPPKTTAEEPKPTAPPSATIGKCGKCGAKMPINTLTDHFNKEHAPVVQVPAEPKTATGTAGTPPTPTPTPVSPIISAQQQPPTEAARRKNFFGEIAGELRQGGIVGRRAFDRLLGSGAIMGGDIGDEGFGVVRGKQRSEMARFLKDQKNLDEALKAFNLVLREFVETQSQEERTGLERGMGGRARSMAGDMPGAAIDLGGVGRDEPGTRVPGQAQAKAELTKKLLGEVSASQLQNQRKYATDPKVQAIRAAFEAAEAGATPENPNAALGAITGLKVPTLGEAGITGPEGREMSYTQPGVNEIPLPDLAPIEKLISQDKITEARAQLVTGVGQVFTALPKLAGKFFPSSTKRLRGVGHDEAAIKNPGLEVWSAAVMAMFGNIVAKSKPREDEATKEARRQASTRGDVRRTAAGDVIPEEESIELGARPETRGTQSAGQAQVVAAARAGQDPEEAARQYFAAIGGLPEKFETYYSTLDQVAITAAQTAFQNEGPPLGQAPVRRGRAPKAAQTQKFGDVVRGFEAAQREDLGPVRNKMFSFKQVGPVGPTSEVVPVDADTLARIAEKERQATEQRLADEAVRTKGGPASSRAARAEAEKAEAVAQQKAKDDALKAMRAKGKREVGGGVEGGNVLNTTPKTYPGSANAYGDSLLDRIMLPGQRGGESDPIGKLMRSFPNAAVDFAESPFDDDDMLELLAEKAERLAHDFPKTAGRLASVRDAQLDKDRAMGQTRALIYEPGASRLPLVEYLQEASRGEYELTIGSSYMGGVPGNTGTSADFLNTPGILEHEFGHAVDISNKSVLSGYAASEAPATRYGGSTPTENAAELFAMRDLPQGVKPNAPDFYEMLGKLSAHERHLMRREVGGGAERDVDLKQVVRDVGSEARMKKSIQAAFLDPDLSVEMKVEQARRIADAGTARHSMLELGDQLNSDFQRMKLDWTGQYSDLYSPEGPVGDVEHNPFMKTLGKFGDLRKMRQAGGGTRAWTAESSAKDAAYHAQKQEESRARKEALGADWLSDYQRREAEAELRDPGSVLGGGAYGRWKKAAGAFNIPDAEWEPEYHKWYGEGTTEEIRAKAPSGPSLGRIEGESEVDTLIDKLKRMAEQTAQSPNEAAAARMHLRRKGIEGYASGGGLMARLAAAREKNEYLVGEKRPELFTDDRGNMEIVGENGPEVRGFARPGKITPNVPEWIRRGMAKDLTQRATGGATEGDAKKKKTVREYLGPLAAEPQSGLGPPYKQTREGFEGERASIAAGQLSPSGGVQRVFVVNFPTGMAQATGKGPAFQEPAEPTAAGAFGLGMSPDEFFKRMGATFQKAAPKQARAKKAAAGAAGGGDGEEAEAEAPIPGAKRGPETAVERVQRLINAQDASLEREADLKRISTIRSGAVSLLAQRGVQTAGGEIVSTKFGGRQSAIERERNAALLGSRAQARSKIWAREAELLETASQNLLKMQTTAGTSAEALTKQEAVVQDHVAAVDLAGESYADMAGQAEKAAKGITSAGGVLKNFGLNLAGIIGGTFVFGGALTAAQAGLSAIVEIASPVIERMTGYANVTAAVTKGLAEQSQASGGAIQATVALATANANLSSSAAATISPMLEQRASTEAGNQALQKGIELFNASEAIRKQNASAGGADQGITRTTGGAFGSIINGIPSTSELVGNFLRDVSTTPVTNPEGLARAQARRTEVLAGREPAELTGLDLTNVRRLDLQIENLGGSVEDSTGRFEFLNEAIKKGGESFEFVAQAKRPITETERAEQVAAAQDIGAFDVAANIKDLKSVILDAQGNVVTDPAQISKALQAANLGFQTPDPAQLIKTLTDRVIPAQLGGIEAEAALQTEKLIPAQEAVQFLSEPPTPFGAGVIPGAGMVGPTGATPFGGPASTAGFGPEAPGVDPSATQSFNQYQQVATTALDAVAAKAKQGQIVLREMGVPQELISQMTELGAMAQGIELGIADRNAAFSAAQYNRQLFQMNRNLADARALLGQNTGEQGRLGNLQRANFEISKQQHALQIAAQTLSLDLSQRQINFQRAIAGFTAPGITPEERQARVKEAKIEADFAQKQLDIQRKLMGLSRRQFNIDVNIFDESARRQVQDLQLALQELKQGHELEIRNKLALQALAAVRKQEALVTREIGVAIEKATKKASLAINSAIEITTKTGEAFSKILLQTAKAWNTFLTQGSEAIDGLQGSTGGREPGESGARRPSADGLVGTFGTATNLTVGEAGTETVAVLRNVRTHALQPGGGGGGGGGMIVVDVHDNTLATKEDEEKFVNMIIRAVDKAQGRKLQLMGGRAY